MTGRISYPVRCGLALVSGLVYALAYPPAGFGWLVVPGLAGLLIALRGQRGTRGRAIGFIHGMTAYATSLSWLFQIFGGVTIMLWCVLAAFTALFAEMQCRAVNRGMVGWKLVVFTALNWCGWEFIRAELFPLKFPWMTAGLAMGPNHLLPWIGVYGVSVFIVILVAAMIARKWVAALLSFGILLVALSVPSGKTVLTTGDPLAVKVGGLQFENVSLTEFLKGTRDFPSDIQYVVWPEYAVPYDLRTNKRDWELVQNLCRERNITLTLGTQARPTSGGWRNIALTLDAGGVRGEHTKVHTVHLFDDGIAGTTALPIETAFGKVGTPICFDCDYEGIVRKMTAAGAEMFVVPMMDAGNWTARQHEQHAALFRIRACENGRWMFVCGTSGVSQIIDPQGEVHAKLASLESGPMSGTMKRETQLTFYTCYGWLVPWCVLGGATIPWLVLLLPFKKRSPASQDVTA
ncbi:MAG: nitrilase-related carbon-nitrogen hydrolase [Luteolibacter sp.]